MFNLTITKNEFNGEVEQSVNARDLWEALEVDTKFADWVTRKVKAAQLIEGQDFVRFLKYEKTEKGNCTKKEYVLTLDAAKHLAMLEGTEKGRQVRAYFISVEKKARKLLEQATTAPIVQPLQVEVATRTLKATLEAAAALNVPKHMAEAEAVKETRLLTGIDYSKLLTMSPAQDNIQEFEEYLEPTELGKLLGVSGIAMNKKLQEAGLQVKDGKIWKLTEDGFVLAHKHHWERGGKTGYNYKWHVKGTLALLKGDN